MREGPFCFLLIIGWQWNIALPVLDARILAEGMRQGAIQRECATDKQNGGDSDGERLAGFHELTRSEHSTEKRGLARYAS